MAKALLKFGGFTPLTSIDYPDQLSAVVFCQGCPWQCRYCQNGELLKYSKHTDFYWPEIMEKLQLRVRLLDAIVFSGGEPTLQTGLTDAISDIKALGFKAGLHTAGCYPEKLEKLLPELDWVGLDIKTLEEDYSMITGVPGSGKKAWQSLRLLQDSDTDYEVRVTVHNKLLSQDKLMILLQRLADMKIPRLALQQCYQKYMLDPACERPTSDWQTPECIYFAQQHFKTIELRT